MAGEAISSSKNFTQMNQMSRWVTTKEFHCNKIITKISADCLCEQMEPYGTKRGSPFKSEQEYVKALKAHHATMQWAMKCKQSDDEITAIHLVDAIKDLGMFYKPV